MSACINAILLDAVEVELNVATVKEEIPLNPYGPSDDKDRYVSKEKSVVLFTAFEANGLGPFYECRGPDQCSPLCTHVLVADVIALPTISAVGQKAVLTLAHQVYLATLSRRYDGPELAEKAEAVLTCKAPDLARQMATICSGPPPEITHEVILAQARIRQASCERVRAALAKTGGKPLKMVGATAADHPLFTEMTFAKGRLIHAGVNDNLMGDVWEEVRHGAGKPLVSSPFIALVPPGDKALAKGQHMTVEETADLLALNFYLQQHSFSGAVQCILVALPPTTQQCAVRLDALLATVRASAHVQLILLPPPPSCEPSYRSVASKLLSLADQPHLRPNDYGRSIFEIGFFGRVPDRRFVLRDGKWSDAGRTLLRLHLLEVSALCPLKFFSAPAPPPPPPPVVRSVVVRVPPQPPRGSGPDDSRKRPYGNQLQTQHRNNYMAKRNRH